MLPNIIRIYYKSDFMIQWKLADGYNGQEFRFTLFTNDEVENGWVASYIDGQYTNCIVEDDKVNIYVDSTHTIKAGCLTVQSEYDYDNTHFADNIETVKDSVKTNIYLVLSGGTATSASFVPSNLPDLSGSTDYVTFSDLAAASYASTTYVAEYVSTYAPVVDLSSYVTKTELSQAGYITSIPSEYITQAELSANAYLQSIPSEYITQNELSANGYLTNSSLKLYPTFKDISNMGYMTYVEISKMGYATEAYVADYVASHSGDIDLSAYVTKTELSQAGYITSIPSEYITQAELSANSYLTEHQSLEGYATEAYVADYVASYAPVVDLSSYVTYSFLSSQAYLQSIPSEYITQDELSANAYLTTVPENYATKTYVEDYVASHSGDIDLSAYVTKDELSNAGYITSIPSEYITQDELSANAYLTQHQSLDGYATEAYVVDYVSTYAPEPDLSAYVTKTELDAASYVSQSQLSSNSYATQTYVADYVASHSGDIDLSAYVTKTELSEAGYITSIPSEYITQNELSLNGYLTSVPENYATKAYVVDYVSTYAPEPDLSAYVTKDELSNAGYITSIPSEYITQDELSANAYLTQHQSLDGYATEAYVVDYVSTYAPVVDLSSYVTKDELSNAGYITSIPSEYITQDELSLNGYLTSVPENYATKAYVADYVSTYAPEPDLSAYVTKTELSEAGYITSIPSEYITQDELSANAYLTQHQSLDGYATEAYVVDYVSTYAPEPDLSAYVTKDELSSAGYITSIPSEYATYDAISQMGYITAIPSEYITQDELSANAYLTQHQSLDGYATEAYVADYVSTYAPEPDLSAYVTKTELSEAGYITSIPSEYITQAELSSNSYLTAVPENYATKTYVADYVATYSPQPDLSSYVTYSFLSSQAYLQSVPSEYITQTELSSNAYLTQHQSLDGYATETYVANYVATYAPQTIIDENIIPNTNNTYTLGDSSHLYKSTYTTKLYLDGVDAESKFLTSYNFQYDSLTNTLTITI